MQAVDAAQVGREPRTCRRCSSQDFGMYTSSSTGKVGDYCRPCRRVRAQTYQERRRHNGGRHTRGQWLTLIQTFEACPGCGRPRSEIPPRPDRRFRYVWTKDHITPISAGGSDDIANIQPLCYHCQFSKGSRHEVLP